MIAVDTNVLLYVHDSREPVKQAKAATLIKSLPSAVLLWQVSCEYVSASRKLAPLGFSQQDAWVQLKRLEATWGLHLPSWNQLLRAEALIGSHSISFWDALIVAGAIEAGASTLYSEDLTGLGSPSGFAIINPFTP